MAVQRPSRPLHRRILFFNRQQALFIIIVCCVCYVIHPLLRRVATTGVVSASCGLPLERFNFVPTMLLSYIFSLLQYNYVLFHLYTFSPYLSPSLLHCTPLLHCTVLTTPYRNYSTALHCTPTSPLHCAVIYDALHQHCMSLYFTAWCCAIYCTEFHFTSTALHSLHFTASTVFYILLYTAPHCTTDPLHHGQ